MARDVIEENIIKAIRYKLNNEEQAWKKQSNSQDVKVESKITVADVSS